MALFNTYSEAENYARTTSGLQSISRRADGKYEVKAFTDTGGNTPADAFRRRVIQEINQTANIPTLNTTVTKPDISFGQIPQRYVASPAPQTQTPAITPSVQYADQDWMTLASSLNGRMPTASEINPLTGKPFAWNPATGAWDDNYFNQYVIPKLTQAYSAVAEDIALFEQVAPSTVSYSDIEAGATKELTDYYNKLLDEYGNDVQLAIKRMEEDYQTGKRKVGETFKTGVEDLYATAPTEMRMLMEQIAAGGGLSTPTGRADTELTTTVDGQQVTAQMPTRMQFGGYAGQKIAMLSKAQKARQDALERAKREQEEELGLEKTRGLEDIRSAETKYRSAAEQEKRQNIQDLALTRYTQALTEAGKLKAPLALSPYTS